MKKIYKYFLFIFSLFSSLYCSQIPGLINYNEDDGLNSYYTYSISQDNKGFIWIGSDNGFFRFDGKDFVQYTKKNGLKNVDILACRPLSNGEIFIAPFLNDFAYLKNGKIINSDQNKELKKLQLQFKDNPIIFNIKDSMILYSSRNPQKIFIYKNEKVKSIPLYYQSKSKPDKVVGFGFESDPSLLFLSSPDKKIIAYNIFTKKETVCNLSLTEKEGILVDKKDFVIVQNEKKVDIYQLENQFYFRKIHSYTSEEDIYHISIDKDNRLWICLQKGGILFFNQDLHLRKKLPSPVKLLSDYIINGLLVDADHNIWMTTKNSGLFFIAEKFFKNYINLPVKNNSSYITAISDNGKDIFLGYNEAKGGIFHSNKITDITIEENRKLEHKGIFSKGNIIIFGLAKDVFTYNTITKTKKLIHEWNLKNIIPYTDHSVLFCVSDALVEYNFVKNTYSELVKERTYTALPYDRDSLFVGDFKDLFKFNIKTKKKTLFLGDYYFTDIKKLGSNLFVGATNLQGIVIFNNQKILHKVSEENGLITDQIKKIQVESPNVFWASSNSGLSRVEMKGNSFKIDNFTQTDGLPSNIVAGCVIRKDTIYVGTSKGLGIFSIKKLLTQQKFINKKVIINSVVIGGKEFFDLNEKLTGESPNNDVIFNLSFPDYASQGKIHYKYKIEGLNKNWYTGNSSKIIFNSLPPGKYIFKVFGVGYNGKQSHTSTDLSFEIKPKFWQTWWFTALLILFGGIIIFLIINLYFQKRRNKKVRELVYEKKIAELELQAIKAQINPHFIYNCLNSIQFLLYKKDYQETENYLDVFSQMIRKTLHYSEKTFMTIKDEAEYLSLYLNMEKLRLKDKFDYSITVSDKVNQEWTIPSLLIQPFVENAIKHGISGLKDRKGNIQILFDYADSVLCITIEDNGVGIQNIEGLPSKTNSFGVKLSQKRIETFKQLFKVDIHLEINNLSENNKQGTQIKIHIHNDEKTTNSLHHR